MNRRETGGRYEETAAAYLEEQGVRVLQKNFRCRGGEIDLIGRKDGAYLFVEVKYRADQRRGGPAEAVDKRKQRTICRTADFFRMKNGLGDEAVCRFDVVAILGGEICWYQNAFEYQR